MSKEVFREAARCCHVCPSGKGNVFIRLEGIGSWFATGAALSEIVAGQCCWNRVVGRMVAAFKALDLAPSPTVSDAREGWMYSLRNRVKRKEEAAQFLSHYLISRFSNLRSSIHSPSPIQHRTKSRPMSYKSK